VICRAQDYERQYQQSNGNVPQIPCAIEVTCRLLALQRRLLRLLSTLEPSKSVAGKETGTAAEERVPECFRELRNILFDTDLLVTITSQLPR
jgi:hypothetical protein